MIIVSDTSPITNLALVGHLDILQHLYGSIVIPQAVAQEIAAITPRLTDSPDILVSDWFHITKAGFWISRELYDRVVQAAGE